MNKHIFLCASMHFYKTLVDIEKQLEAKGFTVGIPGSAKLMKERNDFEVSHFKGVRTVEERKGFIHKNFENITKADSILVINNEKNGVKGYIGPNVLMEIGMAFYFNKKMYLWNAIEESAPYKEELSIFGAVVIHQDLTQIG